MERGMCNCCEKTVSPCDSSDETFAGRVADWPARLTAGLDQSVQASDQTLGHLEEQILHQTRDLERRLLAEAAQSPPLCPVCGHPLSRGTRDHPRTFHKAGRADRKRGHLDEQMRAGLGAGQMRSLPREPFTLVIEVDAWNIRERDDWGHSAPKRAAGQEPQRWHWTYGGTCFRLDQRVAGDGGRARISSRGTVMTRGGVDELRDQLFAEAQRQGLAQAAKVVVADGALWIWNLAGDCFGQAQQRRDDYHASQHLWAVAHALHPEAAAAARTWIKPLLKKLKNGRVLSLRNDLRPLAKRLRQKKRQAVQAERSYLENHRERMDCAAARPAGEPQGCGAMESTCSQYQCRFKRPGQCWSCGEDEGLMCLESFWRNHRSHLLFPHTLHGDPRRN